MQACQERALLDCCLVYILTQQLTQAIEDLPMQTIAMIAHAHTNEASLAQSLSALEEFNQRITQPAEAT